ncbi:MAG: hypothetical protein K940chlam8_00789 [Chlamydiae bacterium]|nr:hypothetical protein [Chlamydiota bacterium]
MKILKKVYLLHYVNEFEDGHDDVKLIGVFSSKEKAKRALKKIKKNPLLKRIHNKFEINECRIGLLGWTEGFVTFDE